MNPDLIRKLITKRRIIIGTVTLAALAVLYVGMSWYIVAQALKADVVEFAYHPDELGLTYEDVEFHPRGDESITLRGWWLPADDAVGSIIWVHGLDENRAEQLPMLRDLINEGFSILAFDLRGHGQSDIVPLGAGYKEPADVRGAIDFLLEEKNVASGKVLLMGRSFGAAIVLIAGVGEPAVVGVYADSPFASLEDLMIGEIEMRTPFPGWFASMLRPGIVKVADLRGIKLDEVRPEVAVAGYTDFGIGLAHCRADERIPFQHSVRIRFNSGPGIWFNLYPRCGHTEAYDDFAEQYVSTVTDYFIERLESPEVQP
ncbi:MAG: alpha/beta fold hydrolase [Chloroflexi bacterium]|nr:alpha/beta fold hydrolase [Chloroflexota bacterium]MDA1173429.1 alpha/beta fold hydrolase [Chloroflexota bacterium]